MNRRFDVLPRLFALATLAGSRSSTCVALGLLVAFATPAAAAWPYDPSNSNVALCTATNDQYYPAIVSDGSGGTIIAWADSRSGSYGIYAQRLSGGGVPQWTANGVALCSAIDAASATIVSDGAGGAIVTWQDFRGGTNSDIYVQRVDAAGVPQWTTNGVVLCAAADRQAYPTIVSDGAGGAIVTWYDFRSGTSYDIYAQRVSAAGVPQWTANGVALCTAAEDQFSPTIATDGSGGAIVTWYDERIDGYYSHIYAQRVSATGVPQWTANGVALCTAPLTQGYPMIVSDGSGGAIVTWYDWRSNFDIYAQRVSAAGVPQWTANGVALCTAADNQVDPKIASDGSGGAIVTWQDWRVGGASGVADIYAQRVSAAGVPQWTANGVAMCTATGSQLLPAIAADGSGGAVVTWYDGRGGTSYDIYAQRVSATGVPLWTANGAALCTAAGEQKNQTIVPDGSGGAIVTWQDSRNGNQDIYAQRIERNGLLGPEPTIASVRDVPNDQGKQVRIVFGRSRLDYAGSPTPITGYQLYRREIVVGAEPWPAAPAAATGDTKVNLLGWDYLMSVPARGDSFYQVVLPTLADSNTAGIHRVAFLVSATTATPTTYYDSEADSGYSVDNIPPVPPAPFTAAYSNGATHLHWGANAEPDFWYYRLYRGNSSGFIPGPENEIASQSDTGHVDLGPAGAYYKLQAVDVNGNVSGYALITPGTTVDVNRNTPREVFLAAPSPNPARASAIMRFGLPHEATVSLRIYDVNGRLLRELAKGTFSAGGHNLAWNLRDDAGERVHGSIFYARLTANGTTQTRRFVVVR